MENFLKSGHCTSAYSGTTMIANERKDAWPTPWKHSWKKANDPVLWQNNCAFKPNISGHEAELVIINAFQMPPCSSSGEGKKGWLTSYRLRIEETNFSLGVALPISQAPKRCFLSSPMRPRSPVWLACNSLLRPITLDAV